MDTATALYAISESRADDTVSIDQCDSHRLGNRLKDMSESDLQLMHLLENEACKADRLVRDLTDLSLCESGRLNLSSEKISAFDVLQEMFSQLEFLTGAQSSA